MLGMALDSTERRISSQITDRHDTEAQATKLFVICITTTIAAIAACIYAVSTRTPQPIIASIALGAMQLFFAAFFASVASFPYYGRSTGQLPTSLWQGMDNNEITADHVLKALIADNNRYIDENNRLQIILDRAMLRAYILAGTTPVSCCLLFFALELV